MTVATCFVNKVLLEYSCINNLFIVYSYFHTTLVELNSCDKDCMAHKYLVSGPL